LVDANIIGIYIWNVEGDIIDANDAFLDMVGYDREPFQIHAHTLDRNDPTRVARKLMQGC